MRRLVCSLLFALGGLAACGDDGNNRKLADAPPSPDAPPDSMPPAKPLPAYEVTGGAKAVSGTRFRADVQIGHPFDQAPVVGGGKRVQGNAAIKP
ncbi:MAG: hypothetical protein AB7T06_27540 [Kofleriaceae bacterium]